MIKRYDQRVVWKEEENQIVTQYSPIETQAKGVRKSIKSTAHFPRKRVVSEGRGESGGDSQKSLDLEIQNQDLQ